MVLRCWDDLWNVYVPYEYRLKVKNMNGKFTFGGLMVVRSVDGGMDTIHTFHKVKHRVT